MLNELTVSRILLRYVPFFVKLDFEILTPVSHTRYYKTFVTNLIACASFACCSDDRQIRLTVLVY